MTPNRSICVALIMLLSTFVEAQSHSVVKTWEFKLPHGTLEIGIQADPGGSISLSFGPIGQSSEAPIEEQVEPLKQVLAELPNLGLDPRKLVYLGTHMLDESIIQKLAFACADSKEWKASMHTGGKGKERLVVSLLNQSGAYEPYNKAFVQFGVRVHVTEAENVGLTHFSQIPPRNAHDRTEGRLLVPADAILGMRFTHLDAKE